MQYKTSVGALGPYTLIEVIHTLRHRKIFDELYEVIQNDDLTCAVLIYKKMRFRSDMITIHRLSRYNYHVNLGHRHYRARTAKLTIALVIQLLNEVLPPPSERKYKEDVRL